MDESMSTSTDQSEQGMDEDQEQAGEEEEEEEEEDEIDAFVRDIVDGSIVTAEQVRDLFEQLWILPFCH